MAITKDELLQFRAFKQIKKQEIGNWEQEEINKINEAVRVYKEKLYDELDHDVNLKHATIDAEIKAIDELIAVSDEKEAEAQNLT